VEVALAELLANGRPVLPDEIAMLAHVSQEKVLSTLHGFGAEFDKESNVVGLGLTLVPTTHVYQINGRKLYTWCAVDALVFPIMLGHTAQIESRRNLFSFPPYSKRLAKNPFF
jgi:alkylmercury lyase